MIRINEELKSLIPPLTPEEYRQLEQNILKDGCHDALVLWQEEQTLLDGHNRYEICERHGLPYNITELSLPDLDAAKAWMISNQLGRRNLTPEQTSYFRGEQYNLEKRQGKRSDLTSPQSEGKLPNTAQALADQHKVGKATIERDGAYARAVDTIAEAIGPEARQAILARDTKLTQEGVKQLAAIAQANPEAAQEVVEAVKTAKTPKLAKAILAEAVQEVLPEPSSPDVIPTPLVFPVIDQGVATVKLEALLQEALRSLGVLKERLDDVPLPETLDTHLEHSIQLAKACRQMTSLLTKSQAVCDAVFTNNGSQPKPSVPREYGALTKEVEQVMQRLKRFTCAGLAKKLRKENRYVWQVLQRLVKQGKLTKEGEEYVVVQSGKRKARAKAVEVSA